MIENLMAKLSEVMKKLETSGTFADFGYGTGRSTTELSKLYPKAKFSVYNAFEKNINMARENARTAAAFSNISFFAGRSRLAVPETLK